MGESMREGNKCYQKLKIEFHRTYLMMALGFVLTGHFLNLIVFTSLILIHELGHYIIAKLNHFSVEKIIIYPYGGMTKLHSMINRDINEELLVATAGIIWQYFFYLFIYFGYTKGFVREYTYNLYTLYNHQMIFFNLLPVYPLDGSKIINLLLEKYIPYHTANNITILISMITLLLLIILNTYQYNYSNLMIFFLLSIYLYQFYRKRKYFYHKFLLERYLYKIEYSKTKVISHIYDMYKNKSHLFRYENRYIKEKDVLSNLFQKEIPKK